MFEDVAKTIKIGLACIFCAMLVLILYIGYTICKNTPKETTTFTAEATVADTYRGTMRPDSVAKDNNATNVSASVMSCNAALSNNEYVATNVAVAPIIVPFVHPGLGWREYNISVFNCDAVDGGRIFAYDDDIYLQVRDHIGEKVQLEVEKKTMVTGRVKYIVKSVTFVDQMNCSFIVGAEQLRVRTI